MFDYVNFECECPICGEKVIGFQTKDGPLLLETLEPLDVNNFYSNCSNCGAWIEFYDTDNFSKKLYGSSYLCDFILFVYP